MNQASGMRRFIGCLGCMSAGLLFVAAGAVSADSLQSDRPPKIGNAEAGRQTFNGKGVCSYCHGIDGYRERVPRLADDTAAIIARLNPRPADLRNPKQLRLQTDQARGKVIKDGHEGTAMFPDATMTEQEVADLLAYLALLRQEGRQHSTPGSPATSERPYP